MLNPEFTAIFQRDVKRLQRKHQDMALLREVMDLILADTMEAKETLRRRHNAHTLRGAWAGSNECHVANAGDWLLIWKTGNGVAVFQRTGTHDQLFR